MQISYREALKRLVTERPKSLIWLIIAACIPFIGTAYVIGFTLQWAQDIYFKHPLRRAADEHAWPIVKNALWFVGAGLIYGILVALVLLLMHVLSLFFAPLALFYVHKRALGALCILLSMLMCTRTAIYGKTSEMTSFVSQLKSSFSNPASLLSWLIIVALSTTAVWLVSTATDALFVPTMQLAVQVGPTNFYTLAFILSSIQSCIDSCASGMGLCVVLFSASVHMRHVGLMPEPEEVGATN